MQFAYNQTWICVINKSISDQIYGKISRINIVG